MSGFSPEISFDGSSTDLRTIQGLMDEVNRQADLLDALNKTFKIISQGTVQIGANAGPIPTFIDIPLGSGAQFTFMAFVQPSDQAGKWFPLPYATFNTSGSFLLGVIGTVGIVGGVPTLEFSVQNPSGIAPSTTFNIAYLVLQQPTNITV